MSSRVDLIKARSELIERERAIHAMRERAEALDDDAMRDEAARLAAENDQDWEDWKYVRDCYQAEDRERDHPPEPALECTPEQGLADAAKTEAIYDRLLSELQERIDAEPDGRGRRTLEATKMEWLEERENVRDLRSRWAAMIPRSSTGATYKAPVVCARLRIAPRPRAARPRAVSRASSRGGDSGDDSSGEPDLPAVLARLGRALWRALITRWLARVHRHGGD